MEQPPPKVVRRAAEGEEQALEVLVRMFSEPIRSYLERLVGDYGDSQDLTQEAFLRMARGLPDFAGKAKFSTWLFQIAKNLGIDHLRRRELDRVPLHRVPEDVLSVSAPEYGLEESDLLWACIADLDVDLRSTLILRDLHGFSYREIAEIVGATLSTVRWRIYQAREQVQTAYRAAAEGVSTVEEQ